VLEDNIWPSPVWKVTNKNINILNLLKIDYTIYRSVTSISKRKR
jgi:hypothetical protein